MHNRLKSIIFLFRLFFLFCAVLTSKEQLNKNRLSQENDGNHHRTSKNSNKFNTVHNETFQIPFQKEVLSYIVLC